MNSDSKDIILKLVATPEGETPHELARKLNISAVAVHKHLRKMTDQGLIQKSGSPPKVRYFIAPVKRSLPQLTLESKYEEVIQNHFCYFTPTGECIAGMNGFLTFLQRTGQDQDPTARALEYVEIVNKAEEFRDSSGLIEGTKKIVDTFHGSHLTKLYYSDFYSLPKYGKTKLGQLLLHGKSGQSRKLIQQIAQITRKDIEEIIVRHSIDALAYAPHSIPRKLQFLKEYRDSLSLSFPEIKLVKVYSGDVPIAQKSLSKLSERIENARQTIFVNDKQRGNYERILVIDDALGSGATLNEIARKLKELPGQKQSPEIFGYAVVGSYKGFEVIKEA